MHTYVRIEKKKKKVEKIGLFKNRTEGKKKEKGKRAVI